MKKQLTEAEFSAAVNGLDVGEQTLQIARRVLVMGERQAVLATELGLSKGAISQAVGRVWSSHQTMVPPGLERVTAVLPAHQAFIVRKWEKDWRGKNRE